jgi:hypothetical protein
MSAPQHLTPPTNGDLFVDVGGNAEAFGAPASTYGSTETMAGAGMGVGLAAFLGVAYGANASIPHSGASSYATVGSGHDMSVSTHSATFSINFPYGQTPVSVSASLTFIGVQSPEYLTATPSTHDTFSTVGNMTHSIFG